MKSFSSLKIERFAKLPSTQLYIADLIHKGITPPDLVIADFQTNGQGRRGRSFYSPNGSGSYFSFSIESNELHVDPVTPRVALAVLDGIKSLWGISCGVKWVNDLYFKERKVCGILTQAIGRYTVIGIGVNVAKPDRIPPELSDTIGWLFDTVPSDVDLLPERVYASMPDLFCASELDTLARYRSACIHLKRPVSVLYDHQEIKGTCIDIDEGFRLLLRTENGIRRFESGCVSLKV